MVAIPTTTTKARFAKRRRAPEGRRRLGRQLRPLRSRRLGLGGGRRGSDEDSDEDEGSDEDETKAMKKTLGTIMDLERGKRRLRRLGILKDGGAVEEEEEDEEEEEEEQEEDEEEDEENEEEEEEKEDDHDEESSEEEEEEEQEEALLPLPKKEDPPHAEIQKKRDPSKRDEPKRPRRFPFVFAMPETLRAAGRDGTGLDRGGDRDGAGPRPRAPRAVAQGREQKEDANLPRVTAEEVRDARGRDAVTGGSPRRRDVRSRGDGGDGAFLRRRRRAGAAGEDGLAPAREPPRGRHGMAAREDVPAAGAVRGRLPHHGQEPPGDHAGGATSATCWRTARRRVAAAAVAAVVASALAAAYSAPAGRVFPEAISLLTGLLHAAGGDETEPWSDGLAAALGRAGWRPCGWVWPTPPGIVKRI